MLSEDQINRLFPFNISLSVNGKVKRASNSVIHLNICSVGGQLVDFFEIFDLLDQKKDQFGSLNYSDRYVFKSKNDKYAFKGDFMKLADGFTLLLTTDEDTKKPISNSGKKIELLAKFPDENPNMVMRFNKYGHVLYQNKTTDVFLRNLTPALHDATLNTIGERCLKVLELEKSHQFDLQFDDQYFLFVCQPIAEYGYVNVYGTNVTKQRETEKSVQKQRAFYENILNSLPSDIVALDSEHRYQFINPLSIKDKELREWLIGKTDLDYCKKRNRSLDLAEKRMKSFDEAVKTKKTLAWEEHFINKNGEEEWHLRRLKPVFKDNGELDIVIGYGIDVTPVKQAEKKIKESEERYRQLVEEASDIIYRTDMLGNFTYANPIAKSLTQSIGFNMIGNHFTRLVRKDKREYVAEFYVKQFLSKQLHSYLEFPVQNNEGKEIWIGQNVNLLINDGVTMGFQAVARDISEMRSIQKSLSKAREKAEQSLKTKERFLANMSHEIRTPLNSIIGMSNLLESANLNNTEAKQLSAVQESGKNLLVIINDILDFSKIEAGQLKFESIGFKPIKIIRSVISSLEYKVAAKDVSLYYKTPQVLKDTIVIGDPTRLNQILVNLVSNAIKFTEQGEVAVSVNILKKEKKSVIIEFLVSDTGIGIEKSKLPKIFESFNQADYSTTRKFGGTGLGLSITKKLIVSQGGKISVTSELNQGSTFSFKLDYQLGDYSDLPIASETENNNVSLENINLLLVEDNKMNQFYATSILDKLKVNTRIANNGQEAIDLLKKETYDVVLMDLQMPVMGGIEATRIARSDLKIKTPIIALTANALKGNSEMCLEAGMDDFLSKPFYESDLVVILQKHLNHLKLKSKKPDYLQKEEVPSNETNNTLYDLTQLEIIASGNKDFVAKMINLFLDEMPKNIAEINSGLQSKDYAKIGSLAHKIKPTIDIMGIAKIKSEIRLLEANCKNMQKLEGVDKLVELVTETLTSVLERLREL